MSSIFLFLHLPATKFSCRSSPILVFSFSRLPPSRICFEFPVPPACALASRTKAWHALCAQKLVKGGAGPNEANNPSLNYFTQPAMLRQIGAQRLAKFLQAFRDDLTAA